jgi:hypothetical protein
MAGVRKNKSRVAKKDDPLQAKEYIICQQYPRKFNVIKQIAVSFGVILAVGSLDTRDKKIVELVKLTLPGNFYCIEAHNMDELKTIAFKYIKLNDLSAKGRRTLLSLPIYRGERVAIQRFEKDNKPKR